MGRKKETKRKIYKLIETIANLSDQPHRGMLYTLCNVLLNDDITAEGLEAGYNKAHEMLSESILKKNIFYLQQKLGAEDVLHYAIQKAVYIRAEDVTPQEGKICPLNKPYD